MKALKTILTNLSQHLHVWKMAWQHHKKLESQPRPNGKDVEFLPAALEIQETPPSPLGRKILFLIVTVFTFSIVWAAFGKIDIITIARGKIIPSDYSKVIQPLETGVIKAIHVRDGQYVKKGDVLIELDATSTTADKNRLNNERTSAMVAAKRLRALLKGKNSFIAPEDAAPEFVQLQQQMLRDQYAEVQNKAKSAKLLIEQRRASLKGTESNIQRLEKTLPLITERAKAIKAMVAKKFVSKSEYLEIEEQRVNKEHELAMERHKRKESQAVLEEAIGQHETIMAEFKNAWQAELSQIETTVKSLSQEETKATIRTSQQTLLAPIDGVVQQLSVHTIGGVVTPAQQLMVVAPNEGQLEVEAWIENKDIGFVNAGQMVEIKVEAFPFTKYGLIDGKLLHLSQDSVPMENVGHVYTTRVSMSRTTMEVGDKHIKLSPGMNVSVEVKTGQRRVIEYFLNPILRGFKETARER